MQYKGKRTSHLHHPCGFIHPRIMQLSALRSII